jgi:hypothetical protein
MGNVITEAAGWTDKSGIFEFTRDGLREATADGQYLNLESRALRPHCSPKGSNGFVYCHAAC